MNRLMNIIFLLCVMVMLPLNPAFAGNAYSNICEVIQDAISNGMDEEHVTTSSIELGHSACLVVKCGIAAGGDINKVIGGALAAGSTVDVISKCAIEAGAEPVTVAAAIENGQSLTYLSSEKDVVGEPFISSLFELPTESISPSTF
jgi:hypothetical protein